MTVRLTMVCILVALAGGVPAAAAASDGSVSRANMDAGGRLLRDLPDGFTGAAAGTPSAVVDHPDGYAGVAAGLSRGTLSGADTTDGTAWGELAIGIALGVALALVVVAGTTLAARSRRFAHSGGGT
jgi:hypothetical protein